MVASSSSINLFSSREQEFEQRAQLLKRLSFTIFCSEEDQYQRYMPDIQGNKKLWNALIILEMIGILSKSGTCLEIPVG